MGGKQNAMGKNCLERKEEQYYIENLKEKLLFEEAKWWKIVDEVKIHLISYNINKEKRYFSFKLLTDVSGKLI